MEAIQDSLLLQFAQRLNEAMEKKGFRKHGRATALAKVFNLSTKACSKWLNGETFPSPQLQQPLASFLDVPVEWLIYGRGAGGEQAQTNISINPIQEYDLAGIKECRSFGTTTTIDGITYVPIVGNATMGPDGFFEAISNDNRTGDGWVRSFSKVGPFAYALRGLGDCMYPAIRSGWIPIFDPEIPPTPMGFVHVNLKDGRQTIKEFIAIQDGMLHLQAVNENRRITFNIEDVHCMAMCAALMMPWERIPDLPVVDFGNE